MITFVVTTYNLEDWLLRRCLDSIVAQGLAREEYEIIVVDDESTVSPQYVVDEYTQLANIALHIQQHKRQGAARNLALECARGEWVQFVDGDDYLFADTIVPLLRVAESNALDLLMFGFRKVGDAVPVAQDGMAGKRLSSVSVTTGNEYMARHNLFGSCCMMLFKREMLDSAAMGTPLRFTEGIYIEDEEFVTKLVWRAQRMARVDVPVYAYYQRVGSTVHSRSREHTDELFRNYFVVLRRLLDFEASLTGKSHEGVTRKVRLLAVDILRRSLRESEWKERWEQSAEQLRELNLYPLPQAHYSWKYRVFRLLAQGRIGRYVLRMWEK